MRHSRKSIVRGVLVMLAVAGGFPAPAQDAGPSAIPVEEDDALLFSATENVTVNVRVANPTPVSLGLEVAVRDFKDESIGKREVKPLWEQGERALGYGANRYFRVLKTLPEKTYAKTRRIVAPGTDETVTMRLGKLPLGFHMLDMTFLRGGKPVANSKFPLAVARNIEPQEYRPPVIPIVAYTRMMQYKGSQRLAGITLEPIFWKTYLHYIACDLREHGINALMSCGGFQKGELAIYRRYGISGVGRSWKEGRQKGVIAVLIGDEPKHRQLAEYRAKLDEARAKTGKPVSTALVGERLGTRYGRDPVSIWNALEPDIRILRWYGIKKNYNEPAFPLHYKALLPFVDLLRIDDACSETPWWITLPTFGKTGRNAYFENPTPAQVKCVMHLSMAHGADGLLLFQYQAFEKEYGLVDAATLKHQDGKMKAVGTVTPLIAANAELLKSLEHGGLDVRCRNALVEVVPRRVGDRLFAYVVNLDTKRETSARLLVWADSWDMGRVRSVYDGKSLRIERDAEGYYSIPITLAPGSGMLLATDARRK